MTIIVRWRGAEDFQVPECRTPFVKIEQITELKRKVIDILRQDRANVQRQTHRDPEDQIDELFASAVAREQLAAMTAMVRGGADMAARIVSGTPVVEVTLHEGFVQVEIVEE